MSGTHRDLLFGTKGRCFECKNHRWGLGPIETSNSNARHGVLHEENHRWVLGHIETCNFGPKVAGFHAKSTDEVWTPYKLVSLVIKSLFCLKEKHRWGLEPIEPSNSGANHAVVHAQNERSCLGPLEICYSGPEFAVLHAKTTGGVLDQQALVILMLATLFCM